MCQKRGKGVQYVTICAKAVEIFGLVALSKKRNGKSGQVMMNAGLFVTHRILMEACRECKITEEEFQPITNLLE